MLTLTLHDPRANRQHTQSFDLPAGDIARQANAIAWYARRRRMPLELVQVSTVTPAGRKLYPTEEN